MRLLIKSLSAAAAFGLLLMAAGAAPIHDLPLPMLKKGIWATTHEVTIERKPTKRYPDSVTNTCFDPAESIRKGFLSAQKDGCDVKVLSRTERKTIYSSTCQGIEEKSIVETMGPNEYKIITISKISRHEMTGYRVRDCTTAKDLPLPNFKKGVWSFITEEHQFKGESRLEPERILDLCDDPKAILHDELAAAEHDGCDVRLVASNEFGATYGGPCSPPRPDGSKDFTLSVDIDSPDEFRMRKILPNRMTTTSGRWLKDCQAGDRVPQQPGHN